MPRAETDRIWAVVLAGGDGRRLSDLTYAMYGREVPKQFAVFEGRRSLLQVTLDRIAPLAFHRRTVVVVGAAHEAIARRQLEEFPEVDLAVQPRNLGTAAGVLFPIARIRAREPDATVAVFPSDHHVPRPKAFLETVREAARACEDGTAAVALLGAPPDDAETDYGWILPGRRIVSSVHPTVRSVFGFVEKPDPALARHLFDQGGLWNTFVSVGSAPEFWRLADAHVPALADAFAAYSAHVDTPTEDAACREIYGRIPAATFSRAILERAKDLAVLPVEGSGWCDLGSPERVFRCLRDSSLLARRFAHPGAREPASCAPTTVPA